jgi:hypothetical protein
VERFGTLELRVAWSIPTFIWNIYVDTLTGQRLGLQQTVVF